MTLTNDFFSRRQLLGIFRIWSRVKNPSGNGISPGEEVGGLVIVATLFRIVGEAFCLLWLAQTDRKLATLCGIKERI
jgi:hypothetical protein